MFDLDPVLFYRDKDLLRCCRTAASLSSVFRPPWNMTAVDDGTQHNSS